MLQKQPIYMKGIENSEAAASGCYEGALIYFFIWLASVLYWTRYNATHVNTDNSPSGYGAIEIASRH